MIKVCLYISLPPRRSWRATWRQVPPCSTAGTIGGPASGHWSVRRLSPAALRTAPSSCSSVWTSAWWWRQRRFRTSRCQRNTSTPSHTSLSCGYSPKPPCRTPNFLFFIPPPVLSLSNVFTLGLQFLFVLFLNFYILYMNLYITLMFEYIDLFTFDLDGIKRKNWGRIMLTADSDMVVCTYSMCECICVYSKCVRTRVILCQHNHSFLFCFEMLEPNKIGTFKEIPTENLSLFPWDRQTYRQTTKDCDGVTRI